MTLDFSIEVETSSDIDLDLRDLLPSITIDLSAQRVVPALTRLYGLLALVLLAYMTTATLL